jgi:hypothetical protein
MVVLTSAVHSPLTTVGRPSCVATGGDGGSRRGKDLQQKFRTKGDRGNEHGFREDDTARDCTSRHEETVFLPEAVSAIALTL